MPSEFIKYFSGVLWVGFFWGVCCWASIWNHTSRVLSATVLPSFSSSASIWNRTTPRKFAGVISSPSTLPAYQVTARLWVPLLAGLLWVASAQATTCQTIDDADQRAYCRAMQTGSRGQCAAIGSYDLRQRCHAAISGNASLCNSIARAWEREQCKAAAKGRK